MYQNVELYCEPESILGKMEEGYCEMSSSQLGFLCGLIKQKNPEKVVEVGVAGGGTTSVIMNCLHLMNSFAKMYSVDLNEKCYRRSDKSTGYQLEEVKTELDNYDNHKFILGNVLPAVIEEIGNNIDFVVLDTVHALPGELLDFLCVLPYLKEGAIVVLHDVVLNLRRDKSSYATKIVMDTAVGEKFYNYKDGNLNIGAIQVNSDTRKYIANVFSAFSISWNYLPSESELMLYRESYRKHYDEECLHLYDVFVDAQIKKEQICNKERYTFIKREELNTVCCIDEVKQDVRVLYEHFMSNNTEMIYIEDSFGNMQGIVSIGDLCRYYEKYEFKLKINNQFRFVVDCDYDNAEQIFQAIKTIHEVPVIRDGRLLGVIRNGITKDKDEWEILRRRLRHGEKQRLENVELF